MKKQRINTLGLFFSLLIFSSCEKVIQLDLNKENPQLVIEAIINIDSLEQSIFLTRTVNFDNEGKGEPVFDANVELFDGQLMVAKFKHVANGEFKTKLEKNRLTEGKEYTLKVVDNEKEVTHVATSICPKRVVLDSIGFYKQKTFGRYRYSVVPLRSDPIGKNWYQYRLKKGWYQYSLKKGGEKVAKILVDDDLNLDGVKTTRKPIFNINEFSPDTVVNDVPKWIIKNGTEITLVDSINVELTLVNIEYKVFRYLYNLALNQGGRQSATPTNPDPLFTNGALGYFSIQSSNTKERSLNNK